jgi:cell division protein FtsW (lipid II flippase)
MDENKTSAARWLNTVRWIARISPVLFIVMFLFFFFADCLSKGKIAVDSDRIVMTVFLFIALIGLIVAWKKEGVGALMTLICLIAFKFSSPTSDKVGGTYVIILLYGIPALLFLYCWRKTRKQNHLQS